jgi:hypothetical protein
MVGSVLMSERFIVEAEPGKFSVIEGVKLNDKPVNRVEADRLVRPLVPKAPESAKGTAPQPKPTPSPQAESSLRPQAETREQAMLRRAAADDEAMTAANAKPIPAAVFEVERWQQKSGSAGFSVNGYLLSGRKPR